MSEYHNNSLKEFIKKRALGRCEYCLWFDIYAPGPFNIEHIIPLSKKGSKTQENLAFSCSGCNGFKSDKTHVKHSESGDLTPVFNPRTQLWQEHFAWDESKLKIVSLTLVGEVTIDLLRLNRPKLLALRSVFLEVGLHP